MKNKNKNLKILIVGAGSIGMRHAGNLIYMGYKKIAICDKNRAKLSRIKRQLKCQTYDDLKTAFIEERPDVVFVCVPTSLHVSVAREAIDANCDVFIEKPLSHSLAGVDWLIKRARNKKRIIMVGCNFRFHAGWQYLKKILTNKKWGAPVLIRAVHSYYLPTARPGVDYTKTYAANKNLGGGVVLDSGSHLVDYLRDLVGEIKEGALLESTIWPLGTKVEEAASLLFRHKSGIISLVSLDYFGKTAKHRLELATVSGLFTLDFRANLLTFEDENSKRTLFKGNGAAGEMFVKEIKHFMDCVERRTRTAQDLSTAKSVLRTLLALKSGRLKIK